jgi:uncharacterized coiled-coil protein SlyX
LGIYADYGQAADNRIADLSGQVSSKDATIASQTSTIAQRDAAIATLNSTVSSQTQTIAQRDATIAARDVVIADLRAQLAQYNVPAGYTNVLSLVPSGGTWVDALALAPAGAKLYLPEGRYTINGWQAPSVGVLARIKADTASFIGAGSDKTVIELVAGTSTWTQSALVSAYSDTNPLSVIQQNGALGEFGSFTLECGEQGHDFHGAALWPNRHDVVVRDLVVKGGRGSGGAPPGETFQFTIHGKDGHRVYDSVFDGATSGVPTATVGLTFQNCVDALAINCTFRDLKASMFVAYQSFDSGHEDCFFYAPTDATYRVASAILNQGERTAGDINRRMSMFGGVYKKSEHVSHSNDYTAGAHYTLVDRNGVTRTTNNGSLLIENPITWPDWWNRRGTLQTEQITPTTLHSTYGTCMIVSTWGTKTTRANGTWFYKYGPTSTSQESTKTAPVVKVAGVNAKYDWLQYGNHTWITAPYTSLLSQPLV